MAQPFASPSSERSAPEPFARNEAHASGVSWSAVIAGAVVATALSLAFLALGTGIGVSAMSPWVNAGASTSVIGWTAIGWLIVTQLIAFSMGGYLAGRLRTRWVHVHTHEVYFRDTVHGFLVWAVALVIAAGFLTSATASARGAMLAPTEFRQSAVAETLSGTSLRAIDQDSGSSRATAQVQAVDTARKAIAHAMYWTFVALLIGAFCASVAATIGGRQRDSMPIV